MDGSWNLYEVWSYDEYLDVFVTRQKALSYITKLVKDEVYMRQDLWIKEISG